MRMYVVFAAAGNTWKHPRNEAKRKNFQLVRNQSEPSKALSQNNGFPCTKRTFTWTVRLPEPSGTKPGTKQNVRLSNISCISTAMEPTGTKLGTKHPDGKPYAFLSIRLRSRAPIIILLIEPDAPPRG